MEINHAGEQRKKWLYRLVIVLMVGALSAASLFFLLPTLLIRPAETKRADVILHFAVRNGLETDKYVAELYQQGYAAQIVCLSEQLTWQVYPADFARDRLIALGVPAQNVTTLHLPRVDCAAELAPFLLQLLSQQKWKSVLLVGDPPASRSTNRVYARRFAKEQIDLSITYAPFDMEGYQGQWWRTHKPTQALVQQGVETIMDLLYPHCW